WWPASSRRMTSRAPARRARRRRGRVNRQAPAGKGKEAMAKSTDAPKIVAIDDDGKRTRVRAVRLEIDYDDGRRLLLDLSPGAWGDLEIEADSVHDSDLPVISLQP